MRGGLALLLVVAACKAQIGDGGSSGPDAPKPPDGSGGDGATDGGLGAWSAPQLIPGADTALDEDDGTLSIDGRELFFALVEPADNNRKHLYTVTRADAQSMVWTAPQRLSFNVTGTTDQTPRLTDDQLTMYFASNRPGGLGNLDIWQVSRGSIGGAWGTPVLVAGVNSPQVDKTLTPCGASRYQVISSRGGASNIYEGTLGGGAPTLVAELSSTQGETGPFLTADCLTVYFASVRGGANAIYTATRPAVGAAWTPPSTMVDFAATGGAQEDPWLAPDARTFVFSSAIGGDKDVYITTR